MPMRNIEDYENSVNIELPFGLGDRIALAISMQQANVCHGSSDFFHQPLPFNGLSAESRILSIMLSAYSSLQT